MSNHAVIYCRISRDVEGTGLGVERQLKDCRALCERDGLTIVEEFEDNDISAYSGKRRPAFEAMSELLRNGGADYVVAWHPDRLTRQPRELEDLIDLLESTKTKVRTCQSGEYDLTTPSGRTTARIVGAVARGESEHKSARISRKHLELAEAGKISGGGTRPFGFEDDRITIRPDEAEVIRQLAKRAMAGESNRSLCNWLDANGHRPTGKRSRWAPTVLRAMLMSPRIAGLREHRGAVYKAEWPAIISEADHRRLVTLFSDPVRSTGQGAERKLLTGLLVCGRCGSKMVSRPKATPHGPSPSYVCARGPGYEAGACGSMRIQGEPLNALVAAAAIASIDSGALRDVLESHEDDEGEDLDDRLAEVEERRRDLGAAFAAGEINRQTMAEASKALDVQARELQGRMRRSTQRSVRLPDGPLAEAWEDLPTAQQRAILAQVIERIEIGPAVRGRNFFDDARVHVTWRA